MGLARTVSAVEARVHFGEIMRKSMVKGDRYIVEKSGIPMVVILNANDYNRLAANENRFKVIERIRSRTTQTSPREVEKDVAIALKAVRRRSHD